MKRPIALVALLICCSVTMAQSAAELYRKADAFQKDKDYLKAAQMYAAGIRDEGNAANIMRHRSAAASWAQAGMSDSAFHFLKMIALLRWPTEHLQEILSLGLSSDHCMRTSDGKQRSQTSTRKQK
jgi:ubiquinone biosynthesis protein COQ9